MDDEQALAQLAGDAPTVGAALWAVYVAGPRRSLPVVEAARPFGGDLLMWLSRLAGQPVPQLDAESPASPAVRRALVQVRDARSSAPGSADELLEAEGWLADLADPLGRAFCALQLADEHGHRGELELAEQWGRRAEGHHGSQVIRALARSVRSNVAVQQGLPEVAESLVAQAVAEVPPGTVAAGLVAMRAVLVAQYAGRPALHGIRVGLEAFQQSGATVLEGQARGYLARTLAVHGRCQEAIAVVREAPPLPPVATGHLLTVEGLALLGLGRLRTARERLGRALAALPPSDQHRWLAAAAELAAASWMGDPSGPGAEVAAELGATLEEDLPGTQLMLQLTRRWAWSEDSRGLLARVRVLDDVELVCGAAGLRADEALAAGDLDGAERWLAEAIDAAYRGAYVGRQRRNRYAEARLALLRGSPPIEALQLLLVETADAGDVLGEARVSALLAEALASTRPARALDAVRRSLELAEVWGIRRGVDRWAWLAAALGGGRPAEAPASPAARFLSAIVGLVGGEVEVPAGIWAVDVAAAELGAERGHLCDLVRGPLERAGLSWRPSAGPTVVIRHEPREVWFEGERLAEMGRARIQHRLLHLVGSTPDPWERDALFEAVWEQPYRPPSSDNTLHVALGRLRKRVGERLAVGVDEAGRVSLDAEVGLLEWGR